MDEQNKEKKKKIQKGGVQKVKKYGYNVICPSNNYKLPLFFDPSLNGHDFFSKTITCSCLTSADDDHKCVRDEDGCRRTRKNEYARQQMKKYREKLKQDPIRYMKYLQSERERNARRKLRKVQKLLGEDNSHLSNEQLKKLQKRHQNLLYRARLRFGQEYLVDMKNTQPHSNDSLSSTNNEFLDDTKTNRSKTYENRKTTKLEFKNNNEVKKNNDSKKNNESKNNDTKNNNESKDNNEFENNNKNDNNRKMDEELSNENLIKSPNSENLPMPSLHFFGSIFNNGNIKNKTTVYEIGKGVGPFTNLKIVNNESDSKDCNITETVIKNEVICDVKEEIISDQDNDNSISREFIHYNMDEDDSLSDTDSQDDNDYKFNRICAIVNCPSRFLCNADIKYYPFPPQKDIRECWFNLIKTKTNQWIVDPDAFVCSLHFAPAWFQKSPSYGNKMLLLNAVPTIFPNGTASQFDLDIPLINKEDYHNSDTFKNYYEWSCMKLREQENLLKDQQVIVENQAEYKIIQAKRIEKLYKVVDEFKKTLNLSLKSSGEEINNVFKKLDDIKTDLIS